MTTPPILPMTTARAHSEKVVAAEAYGWIGFTDHYWMTTLIPAIGHAVQIRRVA